MARTLVFIAAVAALLAGSDALAGTVETVGGQSYSGAVIDVGNDSLQFAWQKPKGQSDEIMRGDSDRAFQAEGDEAVTMSFSMSDVATINGVSPAVFKVLYGSNLFYRLVQTMDRGRVQAMSSGDFIAQVKGLAVLLLSLCLLMPLLMILVARILPGQQMGFLGGIGYSILLFSVGVALATGCSLLTAAVPFLVSPVLQYVLSGALVGLVALVIHVATSHSFWQGLGFMAVWAVAMALGARVALMLLSSGLVEQAIT